MQTWLGLRFVPVPGPSNSGDQVLGEYSHLQLKAVSYHLPLSSCLVFWVYNGNAFSGVPCVSSGELISVCDPPGSRQAGQPQEPAVNHPESQEVLVSNEDLVSLLQFSIGCLFGDSIAPFHLWLPLPACLRWGMG